MDWLRGSQAAEMRRVAGFGAPEGSGSAGVEVNGGAPVTGATTMPAVAVGGAMLESGPKNDEWLAGMYDGIYRPWVSSHIRMFHLVQELRANRDLKNSYKKGLRQTESCQYTINKLPIPVHSTLYHYDFPGNTTGLFTSTTHLI